MELNYFIYKKHSKEKINYVDLNIWKGKFANESIFLDIVQLILIVLLLLLLSFLK